MIAIKKTPVLRLLNVGRFGPVTDHYRFGVDTTKPGDLNLLFEPHGCRVWDVHEFTDGITDEINRLNMSCGRKPGQKWLSSRGSSMDFGFYIAAEAGIDESNIAPFLHGVFARHGVRANTFAALGFTIAPAIIDIGVRNPTSFNESRNSVAKIQVELARHIDRYLDLDVAAGTQRQPYLVYEMYVERSPLEMLILTHILRIARPLRGHAVPVHFLPRPAYGQVAPTELEAACLGLQSGGWLENVSYDTTTNVFIAARGPKLRRLSRKDVLVI